MSTNALSIRHYSIAVHDLEQAAEDYRLRFGMEQVGDRGHNAVGKFDFVSMGYDGQVFCRLITPVSEESPVHRLMQERGNGFNPHGEGLYIVLYECDDVEAFAARVEANGGRITRVPGRPNIFVHPTSSHFVFMEVAPRQPRP